MPPNRALDPRIKDELNAQYLRVQAPTAGALLWNRVLNNQERQRLGGNFAQAFASLGTIGMWRKLPRVSRPRAIVDTAHALGLLQETNYHWLLRGIGEGADQAMSPDRPAWNSQTGELRWKKQLLRRVRVMAVPTNIQIILDAFQAAGWAGLIPNPLSLGQQQLHQALRSLNQGLNKIRFHAREGGQIISWELR
jgi:hypothetical protein